MVQTSFDLINGYIHIDSSNILMNVTLRQLRAFIAVAEAQHFTRAADAISLSQSAISTLVRQLEANLGLKLFDRHTRRIQLTSAGAEILPLARKAVEDLDSVIGSSTQLKTLGRGRVSVAVAAVHAALAIPRVLGEYCAANPGVKVVIHDVAQSKVLEMVRSGEVDFGLGTTSGRRDDLSTRLLWREAYVAILPHGHPLAGKRELTWRDIKDEPIIGPRFDNPIREQIDFELSREDIVLNRKHVVDLPLTMLGMVEGGMGISIMTPSMRRVVHALGLVMKPLNRPSVQGDVSLIFLPDRSLSPAARGLFELIFSQRNSIAKI